MGNHTLTGVVAASCLLIGCASTARRSPPVITSPTELIQQVQRTRSRILDASSQATLSIQIDGVRQKAKSAFFYRSPDSLRLEITGPVGSGLLSALFYRDSVDVYLPRENEFFSGPSNEILRGITGMELGYYGLPHALLGLPDLEEDDLAQLTSYSADKNSYYLIFAYPFGSRRITIDRRALGTIDDIFLDSFGSTLSHRRISEYRAFGDTFLPARISIDQNGNHIHIHHTRTRPNIGVASDQLLIRVPRSAKKSPTTHP